MDAHYMVVLFQAIFNNANRGSALKPPANSCFPASTAFLCPKCGIFSFSECGKRNNTDNTVNFTLFFLPIFYLYPQYAKKYLAALMLVVSQTSERPLLWITLWGSVLEHMQWVSSPFFSSLPEKTDAKISRQTFFIHMSTTHWNWWEKFKCLPG